MTSLRSTPWTYAPASDLAQPWAERLGRFPREPDITVYGLRVVGCLAIRAALKVWHRLEIVGRGHLPVGRPFVMVANHSSHLDAACLAAALPLRMLHRCHAAAAADYFFNSAFRRLAAVVLLNALPFDRRPSGARRALGLCDAALRYTGDGVGRALIVFPEGTRSGDGTVGPFRPGVASLVCGRDVPVVPCHLEGCARAWPKTARLPRPRKVTLTIGRPLHFADREACRESYDAIAAELREAVIALASGGDPSPLPVGEG